MMSKTILIVTAAMVMLASFFLSLTRTPPPVAAQSTATIAPKAVLVELFTSEGCSSCPPADALLRELSGTQTRDGQLIVGISEHVTYWNQLGWSDPYSSQIYTQRQNAYGNHFNLDSVYTPQIVVNGNEQFVGSDRASLQRALHREHEQPETVGLHILSANVEGGSLKLHVAATPDAAVKDAELVAVIADDADQSSVLRGENSGRTLSHVAVARSITRIARLEPATDETFELPLPASFTASQRHHVVLFAQEPGNGRVLGVDTKPI